MEQIHQVFVKLLDGKHKAFNFSSPKITVGFLKHSIFQSTYIPVHHQFLLLSDRDRVLYDHQTLVLDSNGCRQRFPTTVHLLVRLRGGKGGFGSLLRGAATKAGQKKTSNFDACRDMSGRRLRHVNAEKKLEEWKAEAEERKLEKIAQDFIKKKSKEAQKKRGPSGDAERYVAKYREDSAKCMEEVEKSVRESMKDFVNSKRKIGEANGSDAKKFKIWMGKRNMAESDSDGDEDDIDEDDSDSNGGEENERSVVADNGNNSDSGRDGSSCSIPDGKFDEGSSAKSSFGSGSGKEKVIGFAGNLESSESPNSNAAEHVALEISEEEKVQNKKLLVLSASETHHSEAELLNSSKVEADNFSEAVDHLPSIPSSRDREGTDVEAKGSPDHGEAGPTGVANSDQPDEEKPLNFDDFSYVLDMEALGMERLKSELQIRGVKCGGTLQERAARLFLLKTTTVDMLPKKLLAKK